MPSLKAIRKRIGSVKNTQKSTKAMKVVAAAKLRRVQESVNALRPYARRMQQVVTNLVNRLPLPKRKDEDEQNSFEDQNIQLGDGVKDSHGAVGDVSNSTGVIFGRPEKRIKVVLLSSERGLAGSFNTVVYRFFEQFVAQTSFDVLTLDIIGKKGREFFQRRLSKDGTIVGYKKQDLRLGKTYPGIEPKNTQGIAHQLAVTYLQDITEGQFDALYFIYNEYQVGQTAKVRVKRLLPIKTVDELSVQEDKLNTAEQEPLATSTYQQQEIDYIYEPAGPKIVDELLPLSLETQIHRILLESISAELRSRMLAMDNASRNAKEMIKTLTLEFNRARQAAITKELMEVVSGAEAIKG